MKDNKRSIIKVYDDNMPAAKRELADAIAQADNTIIWYQAPDTILLNPIKKAAYEELLTKFIPKLQAMEEYIEYIFCPITDTINVVFRSKYLLGWSTLFRDAGFQPKIIPSTVDPQTSEDLKQVIIHGGNINAKWN